MFFNHWNVFKKSSSHRIPYWQKNKIKLCRFLHSVFKIYSLNRGQSEIWNLRIISDVSPKEEKDLWRTFSFSLYFERPCDEIVETRPPPNRPVYRCVRHTERTDVQKLRFGGPLSKFYRGVGARVLPVPFWNDIYELKDAKTFPPPSVARRFPRKQILTFPIKRSITFRTSSS